MVRLRGVVLPVVPPLRLAPLLGNTTPLRRTLAIARRSYRCCTAHAHTKAACVTPHHRAAVPLCCVCSAVPPAAHRGGVTHLLWHTPLHTAATQHYVSVCAESRGKPQSPRAGAMLSCEVLSCEALHCDNVIRGE